MTSTRTTSSLFKATDLAIGLHRNAVWLVVWLFALSTPLAAPAQNGSAKKAWEYDPYQVVVWIAYDNSHKLTAREPHLRQTLEQQAALIDPSGWFVTVRRAENPWNWRLLSDVDVNTFTTELQRVESIQSLAPDKLVVVTLRDELGLVKTTVQELDMITGIWGPRVKSVSGYQGLAQNIFEGLRTAFMPITRIERVNDNDVQVRVRASGIVHRAVPDENGDLVLQPNTGSPVWIGDQEILLPVIVRRDRQGNIEENGITPIDWTYLSIIDRQDPFLNCTTHAMRRTPLGGRTGGRTERLALCVRAPNRPTKLTLVSNDKEAVPIPDLEILSRVPGMDLSQPSEPLPRTSWQGEVIVPPNDEGIRILLIKSGMRSLARVPVVPGLHDELTVSMPNDERRLFAEGVVRGLHNELMDYVIQRELFESSIRRLLEQNNLAEANRILAKLGEIPDSNEFNRRLVSEEQRLQSTDERERKFISAMFNEIKQGSNKHLSGALQTELMREIQDKTSSVP